MFRLKLSYVWIFFTVFCAAQWLPGQESTESMQFFEQKIRPLLIEHCFECHSTTTETNGGLVLDSREGIVRGGDHGAAVDLQNVDSSLLLTAVHYRDPDFEMPPNGKLSERDIGLLEQWVRMGLPYPAVDVNLVDKPKIDIEAGKKHWSFQPFSNDAVQLPANASPSSLSHWSTRRHDAFILAQQVENNLQPNNVADKRTWIRRAKWDLLGLPASFEEIDAFVQDSSPDAYERVVDQWLSAPQYGERWARSWLELVRYCDVPEQWAEVHHTYRYRDWVLQALNEDMPYDRFVKLQIAADQIEDARNEDLAALGFIGLSPTYWKELQLPVEIIKSIVSDEYEERIYSWSSTFLGVNLACARCHDHKTEPFTQQDYYAIAGVFANSRLVDRALDRTVDSLQIIEAKKQVSEHEAKVTKLNAEIAAIETKEKSSPLTDAEKADVEKKKTERDSLAAQIAQLKSLPGFETPMAPGTIDATLEVKPVEQGHGSRIVYTAQPKEAAIEIRGNPNKLGEVVARRYLSVLSPTDPPKFAQGGGRLELANAMVAQSGPLMARVIVNRIWKLHFGRGIVETPSDFGTQGEAPTHPELLEDLAKRFVENGWSLKWLHKEIMLSATYRQSSQVSGDKDPANQYYTRFPIRRLEVEAWRDTMLSVTGRLDHRVGGEPFDLNQSENGRRTLYGTVVRRELTDMLRLYDYPDPVTHSPQRLPTSTALQQLFVLNSPFMLFQAKALFEHLQRIENKATESALPSAELDSTARRIQVAYRLLYGRQPTAKEMELGKLFVGEGSPDQWQLYCQTLLGSNEFWFVD